MGRGARQLRRALPALTAVLGVVLVAARAVAFVVAHRPGPPGDFGWSAHTPLERVEGADESRLFRTFDDGWTVL